MFEWKSLFSSQILKRGFDYFEEGNVMELARTQEGYRALVAGTENYEVEISIRDEKVYDMGCDCPYAADGYYCKHMAAVLYTIEEEIFQPGKNSVTDQCATGEEKAEKKQDELREAVATIPEPELREIVEKKAREDTGLYNWIMIRYGTVTPVQVMRIKERVDEIAWRYSDRNGFVDYFDGMDYAQELCDFLDREVGTLVRENHLMEAFDLVNYVFHEVGTRGLDGSNGEHNWVADECYRIWEEILEKCNSAQKEKMRQWFREHRSGYVVDFLEDYPENFLVERLQDKETLQENLARNLQYVAHLEETAAENENGSGGYYCPYASPLLDCINIMEKLEYPEQEIQDFCRRYWNFPEIRRAAIQEYLENRQYTEAVNVIEESKKMDKANARLTAEYSRWLIEIYEKTGNLSALKEELLYQVFHCVQRDFIYIYKLKKCCAEMEWEQYKNKLLESGLPEHMKYEFLRKEKMYGSLMQEIRQNGHISYLDIYEKILKKEFPEQVRDMYAEYVKQKVQSTSNRNAYRELMHYMKKVKRYPGGAKLTEKIAEDWRTRYKRRSAMMDELRKAGF